MTGLRELEALGEHAYRSNMVGIDTVSAGVMVAHHCEKANQTMLDVAGEYHFIKGRPSLKAEAMIGRLVHAGGSYQILSRTPDLVHIKVNYKGQEVEFSLSWDQCLNETFIYDGKPGQIIQKFKTPEKRKTLQLKDAYATPHRRMQQMWARLVSDAVRAIAPELITSKYTPREIIDFTGIPETPETETELQDADKATDTSAAAESVAATAGSDQSEDGQPCVWPEMIIELFDALDMPEEVRKGVLNKRDVTSVHDLSDEQAAELVDRLKAKLDESGEDVIEAPSEKEMSTIENAGPISAELEQQIRKKLSEVAQLPGGVEVCEKVQKKLVSNGMKLVNLTYTEGENLLAALEGKEPELFFAAELEAAAAKKQTAA